MDWEDDYRTAEAEAAIRADEQEYEDKQLCKVALTNKEWRQICEIMEEAGYVWDEYGDIVKKGD